MTSQIKPWLQSWADKWWHAFIFYLFSLFIDYAWILSNQNKAHDRGEKYNRKISVFARQKLLEHDRENLSPWAAVILTENIAHSKTSEWLIPSMTFFLMIFKVSQVPIIWCFLRFEAIITSRSNYVLMPMLIKVK